VSPAALRVALYAGVVVQRGDSLSNSALAKLAVLRRLAAAGAPVEVTLFTKGTDLAEPELTPVPTVAKLLLRDEFWAADIHIFETGMFYDLYDAVFVVPPDRPILAIEHNTTPPELVDDPVVKEACARSVAQRYNLTRARHVACVSELNLEVPRSVGVPEDRTSILHLPPQIVPAFPPAPLSSGAGPAHLLYLGRFVRAKGVADMIELSRRLFARGADVSVTLAGNPRFSDPALLEEARTAASGSGGRLRVVLAPDDAETAKLLAEADALVVPSYHEGYCIPVIEAYGFGRFVIGYDAGNLPNVEGGLGALVPTGDLDALEDAVGRFATALTAARGGELVLETTGGPMPAGEWRRALDAHLGAYRPAAFERGFLTLLTSLAAESPAGASAALRSAVAARLAELDAAP
jgi:glycosyltransferase involved in cell wall biosynthesis